MVGVLLLAGRASAQEALVLSGGGSRGLAHAGVFLGLEELGYDPDLVVGTSMGAVLGALYAAGEDPDRIRALIVDVGWADLFTSTPTILGPDRTVQHPTISLDLDLGPLRFSRGLLGQWRVNRALARLLFDANARSRGDFDRLPRRYRAVAADLRTGEAVVLDRGDLARAARASMAVPGFFAPVEWGGRTLVDGGIADNLPTSVARGLGADRVIAADVSRPPTEIHSRVPLAVVGRAIDLMQENRQRDSIPPDGLVLPAIDPSFSGATFPDDPEPLIEKGLEATLRDLSAAATVRGSGERPLPSAPDSFGRLEVDAPDPALAALARRAFAPVIGSPYDPDAVLDALDRLYTTGLFEAIWPTVVDAPDPASAPTLRVELQAPPRLALSAGAGYDNDRGGRGWAALDRHSSVGGRPGQLRAAAAVTGIDRWGALSGKIYMLSRPALAWSLGAHVRERQVRFFGDDLRGAKEALRAGGWLALEFPHLLRDRVLTTSLRAEWVDVEDGPSGEAIGPLLRFASVDPDALVVGVPFLAEGEHRWGALSYSRVALSGSRGIQIRGLRMAALLDLRGVTDRAPQDVWPALGDQHMVPGLRWGELRGQARAVAGLDLAYPVRNGFATLQLRSGTAPADLDAWDSSAWVSGARLGAHWSTPIGAVDVGVGLATVGDGRFDVSLGRQF